MPWWKKAATWIWRELDAVIAIALGIAFAVLGVLNVAQSDVLTAATLTLLAVLAFAIVRDRAARKSLVAGTRQVQEAIAQIDDSISSLRTGEPYRVLTQLVEWDLITDDGEFAVVRKTMRLRFLQNDVASLMDFVQTDGRVSNATYSPGRKVDEFTVAGRRYDLVSLRRLMQAGDELNFEVYREVHGSFPGSQEWVSASVLTPTEVLTIKLTWPKDRPPKSEVRVEHSTAAGRHLNFARRDIDITELPDGRTRLSHVVDQPAEGTTVSILWDW
jgi:hypothetical protein